MKQSAINMLTGLVKQKLNQGNKLFKDNPLYYFNVHKNLLHKNKCRDASNMLKCFIKCAQGKILFVQCAGRILCTQCTFPCNNNDPSHMQPCEFVSKTK